MRGSPDNATIRNLMQKAKRNPLTNDEVQKFESLILGPSRKKHPAFLLQAIERASHLGPGLLFKLLCSGTCDEKCCLGLEQNGQDNSTVLLQLIAHVLSDTCRQEQMQGFVIRVLREHVCQQNPSKCFEAFDKNSTSCDDSPLALTLVLMRNCTSERHKQELLEVACFLLEHGVKIRSYSHQFSHQSSDPLNTLISCSRTKQRVFLSTIIGLSFPQIYFHERMEAELQVRLPKELVHNDFNLRYALNCIQYSLECKGLLAPLSKHFDSNSDVVLGLESAQRMMTILPNRKIYATDILRQISNTLLFLHDRNHVHLMVGPDFVYLRRIEGKFEVKLSCFTPACQEGLEAFWSCSLEASWFLAPEVKNCLNGRLKGNVECKLGNISPKADVFGFGILWAHLFLDEGHTFASLEALKGIAGGNALLLRCLDDEPENRPSMAELRQHFANETMNFF